MDNIKGETTDLNQLKLILNLKLTNRFFPFGYNAVSTNSPRFTIMTCKRACAKVYDLRFPLVYKNIFKVAEFRFEKS
jgi:hypothetical protein